jgi:hypothetical protein
MDPARIVGLNAPPQMPQPRHSGIWYRLRQHLRSALKTLHVLGQRSADDTYAQGRAAAH